MNKNSTIIWIIAIVALGAGAFYGGMKYTGSKSAGGNNFGQNGLNFQSMTAEQRQQRMAQGGAGGQRMGGLNGAGMASGEILAKDDKSITVKMRDGSSKIIFFSPSTQIMKSTSGAPADLKVGENVIVSGKADQSNTITAESIQLRPAMAASSTLPGPAPVR